MDEITAQIADAVEDLMTWSRRRRTTSDLSATALTTLDRLAYAGALRVSELAVLEQVTQPGMTGLINRLADQGLVTRAADPADGRASLVTITASGHDRVRAHRGARTAALAPLLERLPVSERTALAAALPAIHRLTAGLTTTQPPAATLAGAVPVLESSLSP